MPSTMPSSWAAGAGLGLCLASIIAMGALDAHLPIPWARCLAVVVACFGGVPTLEFTLRGLWAIVVAVGGARLEWIERNQPALAPDVLDTLPAPPKVTVIRRVGGIVNSRERDGFEMEESRPARWVAWNEFASVMLDWFEHTGSLTSKDLVGRAFRTPEQWVTATNELARVGLLDKSNGKRSRLSVALFRAREIVEGGQVEWDTESDPPAIYPPAPAREAVIDAVAA